MLDLFEIVTGTMLLVGLDELSLLNFTVTVLINLLEQVGNGLALFLSHIRKHEVALNNRDEVVLALI